MFVPMARSSSSAAAAAVGEHDYGCPVEISSTCTLIFALPALLVNTSVLVFTILVASSSSLPLPPFYWYGAFSCAGTVILTAAICVAVALQCSRSKKTQICLHILQSISLLYFFIFGLLLADRLESCQIRRRPGDEHLPLGFLMFELNFDTFYAGHFELHRRDTNQTYCVGDSCVPFYVLAKKLPPLPPGYLDGTQFESIQFALRFLGGVYLVFCLAFFYIVFLNGCGVRDCWHPNARERRFLQTPLPMTPPTPPHRRQIQQNAFTSALPHQFERVYNSQGREEIRMLDTFVGEGNTATAKNEQQPLELSRRNSIVPPKGTLLDQPD